MYAYFLILASSLLKWIVFEFLSFKLLL